MLRRTYVTLQSVDGGLNEVSLEAVGGNVLERPGDQRGSGSVRPGGSPCGRRASGLEGEALGSIFPCFRVIVLLIPSYEK